MGWKGFAGLLLRWPKGPSVQEAFRSLVGDLTLDPEACPPLSVLYYLIIFYYLTNDLSQPCQTLTRI